MQEEKRKRELKPMNEIDDDDEDDEESDSEEEDDDEDEEHDRRMVHLKLNTRKARDISDSDSVASIEPKIMKRESRNERIAGGLSSPRRITRSSVKHNP